MASKIQIRRDTLANWTANNPVLSSGEIAFIIDENRFKVGNGSTAFSSLAYTTGISSITGTSNEIEVSASTGAVTISLPSTINANTTGSAASLTTARTISLGGDLSGSASFDGTSNITITASVDSQSSVNSITGTENEITVSASVGDITLSLPNTINANTTGTAASLTTARTIALSGDVSGSVTFDGSASVDINTQIQPNSVELGTDTAGNYVSQVTSTGNGLSVTGTGESASVVIENTGVTALSGTANEVEVSASTGSVTISLPSTINANTTGSAATLTNARTIALGGDLSGSASFDGSASISITADIQPNSVVLGTDTTGNYVATASAGSGISISGSGSEDATITISNTGVTSLTGTTNQIAVSASNGDATLSFPSAVTFPGTVTLNANPGQALEAATKQYVDAIAEGLHVHASVATATTASVDLSNAPTAIDGVNLTDGMRVLVKNQPTTADNGIYTYSASADALIRASDFNSSSEIQGGDFLFVTGGNTYENTGWVQTETVTTLGTDPILFTQFSGAGTYSAGTGLQLDGTVFSNTGVLSLAGTANEVEVSSSSGSITISLPSTINANTTGSAASLTTSRTIELSGDVSGSASFDGSANASITSTLANTAVTPATYGSASAVGTFTVDAKGRLTGASNTAIAVAQSAVTNLTSDLALKANLASPALTGTPTAPTAAVDTNTTQIATTAYVVGQGYAKLASPTFTGTVSASAVNISIADTATAASHYIVETGSDGVLRPKTLANVQTEIVTTAAVNAAAATTVGTVTSGTWNATNIALSRGGTNASLTAVAGGIVYSTASAFALTNAGNAGQVLTSNGTSAPTWQDASGGFDAFLLAGL